MTDAIDSHSDENRTASGVEPKDEPPKKKLSLRARNILRTLLVVVLLVITAWFIYYQLRGKYLESTNDAFVYADSVTVAPKVSGYVEQVYVADNQNVQANQPLVRIDPRDYAAQSAQSKAQINAAAASEDAAKAQLQEQKAAIAQARAQLISVEEDARYAAAEVERYIPLAASGAETRERLTSLRNQSVQARSAVASQRAALNAAELRVHSIEAQIRQAQAQGETARAQFDAANVNLHSTEVRASVAGRVGDKQVRVGQFVSAGMRMMTVVPADFYVIANFKETQIGMMRHGQPVKITIDALPGTTFHGHLDSISPGTGAQFSLLPPQNATGNFTKIVQRVPVRIAVDASAEDRKIIVAGLSVTAEVDTGAREQTR